MRTTFRDAALACAFAMTFGATYAAPQSKPDAQERLDSAQVRSWREDLAYMAREMERRHRNLYHTVSRAAFDSAVAALERRIPSLARHQIIVEMARIAALVGDGHTNIAPTRDPKIGFQVLPVRLYFFKDGLFVRAADRAHAHLTGARVVRIGRATPEQALAAVLQIIGRDNEMGARFFAPFLLAMPEVLHALGIIPGVNEATLVLESAGRERVVKLRPRGPAPMMPPDTDVSWWPDTGWVDMRDQAERPAPLWLSRDPTTHFWLQHLPASRLVYVQYNKVGNMPEETIAEFSRRLLALLDTAAVDRLVLDLRLNRGGNGTLNPPLLTSLIKARKLDGPAKLFAIVGRGTFSAAQFLVNELEQYTDAVFVGEPTGGKVNSYGDSRKIVLPHSGLTVRVSTLWWQEDPRDSRSWTAPDIAAELTSSDYRNNVDPAVEAVLAYRPEPPLAQRMADALATGGMDAALRRYRDYRRDLRHAYADTEAEVNTLGYQLIERGRYADAIRILELNVREYPASSNAYDSLAEAYLRAGEKESAVRNYRKSLALDPGNGNARAMLEQLER